MHDVRYHAVGFLHDGSDVFEHLCGFLGYRAIDNVPMSVDRQLPGDKQKVYKLSIIALSFSGDGRWLLTGGQETPARLPSIGGQMPPIETRIRIWDTTTWTEHYSQAFNRIGSVAASFSLDSRILIIEKDWDLVELFDIASGMPLATFNEADPLSHSRQFSTGNLLITPDGSLLIQAAQNGVRIWRAPGRRNTAASKE